MKKKIIEVFVNENGILSFSLTEEFIKILNSNSNKNDNSSIEEIDCGNFFDTIDLNFINPSKTNVNYSNLFDTIDDRNLSSFLKPSARIFQICQVINEVKKGNEFNQAFSNVAKSLKVSEATIRDKASRQLGISIEKFKSLVKAYLENGNKAIMELLKSKISANSRETDLNYLKVFFI